MSAEPYDRSASKAAAFFGVHIRTVQKWANDGDLEGMRTPGDRWRFRQSDLDRFAASRLNASKRQSMEASA